MKTLNRFETAEFLQTFLKGILEVGLFEPLQNLEASGSSLVKKAARSLREALITGATPQVAIGLMSPQFPPLIQTLVISGFEQSNIDFVLKDIVEALKSNPDDLQLDQAIANLIKFYSPLKTEAICLECASSEVQKILKRAQTEQATQVIVSYEKGRLVQKFLAAKLVTITEPAIPAVFETLRKSFDSTNQYQPVINIQNFKVTFMPMNLNIRRARYEDASQIINSHRRSIREVCSQDYTPEQIAAWSGRDFQESRWQQTMDRDLVWVVSDVADNVFGFGHLQIRDEKAEVMGLYFSPEALGKGLGKQMIGLMLKECEAKAVEYVFLNGTKTAKKFYESVGFTAEGPIKLFPLGGVFIENYEMRMRLK